MSAASPASSQVRHRASSPAAPDPTRAAAHATPAWSFVSSDVDDEFKLNLGDIPHCKEAMDVEGFKPSLLSRLFELVAPAKG